MAAHSNGRPLYFTPVVSIFLSFSLLLFSSPNLSSHRLDIYHTSTHDVALVRIWNACLKCAALSSLEIQDAKTTQKIAICTPSHKFLELYLRGWRGGATVRHLGLRSIRLGFKSCSRQRCVTTLGELFTPMCLCHQAV